MLIYKMIVKSNHIISGQLSMDCCLKLISYFSDDDILGKDPVLLNVYYLKQTHLVYLRDIITSTINLLCK